MEIIFDIKLWEQFCEAIKPADPIIEIRKYIQEVKKRSNNMELNKLDFSKGLLNIPN